MNRENFSVFVVFLILIIGSYTSCISDSGTTVEEQSNPSDTLSLYEGFAFDTSQVLVIERNPKELDKSQVSQYIASENVIVDLNDRNSQLVIIDPATKAIKKTVQYNKDTGGAVKAFYYQNADSIFLVMDKAIMLINDQGKTLLRQPINEKKVPAKGIDFRRIEIDAYQFSDRPIYYNSKKGKLYLPTRSAIFSPYDPQFYAASQMVTFDPATKKFQSLKVYYPPQYRKKNYGLINRMNYAFHDDDIIFNLKTAPYVYVFDEEKVDVQEYTTLSKVVPELVPSYQGNPLEVDSLKMHAHLNAKFRGLTYDQYRNVYYRIVQQGATDMNSKKPVYFSVLDADYNVLSETLINTRQYSLYGYFVTPEGVMLMRNPNFQKGDKIVYQIFKVKEEVLASKKEEKEEDTIEEEK